MLPPLIKPNRSEHDAELAQNGWDGGSESETPLLDSLKSRELYDCDSDASSFKDKLCALSANLNRQKRSLANLFRLLPQQLHLVAKFKLDYRARSDSAFSFLRSISAKKTRHLGIRLFILFVIALAVRSYYQRSERQDWDRIYGTITDSTGTHDTRDVLDLIDPLIGTAHGGNVFAGANMPYGMVKAVADCHNENAGGYSTSEPCAVVGFSHMHDSGTGGATSFGNFPLFPFIGFPGDDPGRAPFGYEARKQFEVLDSVIARPGYFGLELQNGIIADMTATEHAALYRFDFPKSDMSLYAPTDPDDILSRGPAVNVDIRDLYGSLRYGDVAVDPENGRLTGSGQFQPSFGPSVWRIFVGSHDEHYTLYFCADFKGGNVRRTGVWHNNDAHHDRTSWNNSDWSRKGQFGAYVQFEDDGKNSSTILTRVGISFISVEKACSNGENEIADFDFDRVRKESETAWRKKFSNIHVNTDGLNNSLQTAFWSGIYRTMISPQDYTGENPLWQSEEPYFDSFYCIWDSFRSTHPFLTIIDPDTQTLMVRALLDIYKYEGKLPDCRMSLCKGNTQGGSNADVLIADAMLKNITKDVDWDLAYEAVVSDAEVEPADWSLEGRGNLESWKSLGYIPIDDDVDYAHDGLRTRSLSRTLEYAYEDYSIAIMAKLRGNMTDYDKYIARSRNWKNVFDPEVTFEVPDSEVSFKGFAQPKKKDGTFQYENPNLCNPNTGSQRPCYLFEGGHSTYEGGSWLYSFYAPHDMAALIDSMGGKDTFVERLTYFHESGIADISDEQSFLTVFQFHYAGRPGLSSKTVHQYIPSKFRDTFDGIPGNDDSGSMGSFQVFCMLGFFPNPGQDVYLLVAPFFHELSLTHPTTGKTATIRSNGWDPDFRNIYIQSAKLNGKPYTKNWITHSFFIDGGVLEMTVGPTESSWGTKPEDLPPSLSTMEW